MRTKGEMLKKDGRRLSNVVILDTTARLKAAHRALATPAPSLKRFVQGVLQGLYGGDESLKAAATTWLESKHATDHPRRKRPQSVINERAARRHARRKGSSGKKKPAAGDADKKRK